MYYELNISPMGEVYEDEEANSLARGEGRFDGADYCDNIIPSFIHSLSAYCIKKSEIKDNVSDGNHLKDACSPLLGKLEDHCNSTPTVILQLKGEDPKETVDPSNLRMLTQESSPMHHHVEEASLKSVSSFYLSSYPIIKLANYRSFVEKRQVHRHLRLLLVVLLVVVKYSSHPKASSVVKKGTQC